MFGATYFVKESVAVIMQPFCNRYDEFPKEVKKERREKRVLIGFLSLAAHFFCGLHHQFPEIMTGSYEEQLSRVVLPAFEIVI